MSEKPVIFAKKPCIIDLNKGEYYWCSCGKSKKHPFCDGSHKDSSFKPVQFKVKEKQKFALCNCKYSEMFPYCDGNHRKL